MYLFSVRLTGGQAMVGGGDGWVREMADALWDGHTLLKTGVTLECAKTDTQK